MAGDSFYPSVCHLDDLPARSLKHIFYFAAEVSQGYIPCWVPEIPSRAFSHTASGQWGQGGCTAGPSGTPQEVFLLLCRDTCQFQICVLCGVVTLEQRSLLKVGKHREYERPDFQLQLRDLSTTGKSGPVFPASSSVNPAPDMKMNLISLHRQSKPSG